MTPGACNPTPEVCTERFNHIVERLTELKEITVSLDKAVRNGITAKQAAHEVEIAKLVQGLKDQKEASAKAEKLAAEASDKAASLGEIHQELLAHRWFLALCIVGIVAAAGGLVWSHVTK